MGLGRNGVGVPIHQWPLKMKKWVGAETPTLEKQRARQPPTRPWSQWRLLERVISMGAAVHVVSQNALTNELIHLEYRQ